MSRHICARCALLFALSFALLAGVSSAQAGGGEVSTEYYAEASHATLVGELIAGCGRRPLRWGRVTAFKLRTVGACSAAARRQDTVAAHVLLHQDPLAACERRCDHPRPPITSCGPDDPPETCGTGPRNACVQACRDTYGQEDPNP